MKTFFRPFTVPLALLAASSFVQAVPLETLPVKQRTNGGEPALALKERFDAARAVTVRFQDGRKNHASGTVVDASGLVLAKLSDVEGITQLTAVMGDMNRVPARIVAKDTVNDLALIKVEAQVLAVATFDDSREIPAMGTMLYAFNGSRTNLRLGVVSALPREVKKPGGVMGVLVGVLDEEGGVVIDHVVPKSGADAGGVKAGDVLLAVDGEKLERRQDVSKFVEKHAEGETITLKIRREKEEKELQVRLGERMQFFPQDPKEKEEAEKEAAAFNGKVSERRKGFTRIIQHDLPLEPEAMGGALWDLEGHVVGLNIARVERVATFALPASLVKESLVKLKAEAEKNEKSK